MSDFRVVIERPCQHGRIDGHARDGWDSRTDSETPPTGRTTNNYCDGAKRSVLDDYPTAEKLRFVATSLDLLSRFAATALPHMRVDGSPIDPESLELLAEWMEGDEQQTDLRHWADVLEGHGL